MQVAEREGLVASPLPVVTAKSRLPGRQAPAPEPDLCEGSWPTRQPALRKVSPKSPRWATRQLRRFRQSGIFFFFRQVPRRPTRQSGIFVFRQVPRWPTRQFRPQAAYPAARNFDFHQVPRWPTRQPMPQAEISG